MSELSAERERRMGMGARLRQAIRDTLPTDIRTDINEWYAAVATAFLGGLDQCDQCFGAGEVDCFDSPLDSAPAYTEGCDQCGGIGFVPKKVMATA